MPLYMMKQQQQQQQHKSKWKSTTLYCIFLFLQCTSYTNGFTTSTTTSTTTTSIKIKPKTTFLQHQKNSIKTTQLHLFDSSSNGSDDIFSSFLNPSSSSSPETECTHLLAIPLEETRDLLLQLESIQRAILYHCPFLIKACIVPVVTRMPLLAVNAKEEEGVVGGVVGVRSMYVSEKLEEVVREVVTEYIFISDGTSNNKETTSKEDEEEEEGRNGVNKDGIKPLFMSFRGLELDHDDNSVLYAIGEEGDGTTLLRKVMGEIASRIESRYGWNTFVPPECPQEKVLPRTVVNQEEEFMDVVEEDSDEKKWRPRVPFMRLPYNFEESLPIPDSTSDDNNDNISIPLSLRTYQDNEGNTKYIRTPEEGGNGISPLFWYNWINDDLTPLEGTRLRSIGIYSRTGPSSGITENSFYYPSAVVNLPEGNTVLQKVEEKERMYDEERFGDDFNLDNFDEEAWEEKNSQQQQQDEGGGGGGVNVNDEAREKLERIYSREDGDLKELLRSLKEEKELLNESLNMENEGEFGVVAPGEIIDSRGGVGKEVVVDVTQEDVDAVVESSSSLPKQEEPREEITKSEEPTTATTTSKRTLPPPEENPILQKFRANRLALQTNPTMATAGTSSSQSNNKPKAPFPADEYFVGVWRLVSSPLDRTTISEGGNDTNENCDNLILRVDGTIAGGPVLDYEYGHKAAGGSWSMFRAVWAGDGDDDDDDDDGTEGGAKKEQVRLRIKLIVPPDRTKVVVMEGEVTRGMMMMMGGSSEDDENDTSSLFASSTFGIPEVENVRKASLQKNKDEDLLHCGGEVWVEDYFESEKQQMEASGGGGVKRRKKLGMFSLMKLKMPNRDTLKYTVPIPRGFGGGDYDPDDDDDDDRDGDEGYD